LSEQPQLKRAVPFSPPDETPSDSLDLAPVGETQALRSGWGEFDDRLTKHDALLGLDRTATRLTLPRLPAIHMKDAGETFCDVSGHELERLRPGLVDRDTELS
jgi:hypothetical protein